MPKRVCPAGQIWSNLLDYCTLRRPEDPQPQPGPPRPPAAKPTAAKPTAAEPTYAHSVMSGVVTAPLTKGSGLIRAPAAGPYLLGTVAVVATGSILALVLWFLIYREHRNRSNWAPLPALQDTDQMDPLPLAPGSYPAEPLWKDPEPSGPHFTGVYVNDITSCMVTWVGETAATGRKHRVPLPATELGDTTLVTAKTGRDRYSQV